jgi:hypothetical protein
MATLLLALVATVAGPPEFASMAYCYLKFETAEGRRVALYKGILPQMQDTCGGGVKCSRNGTDLDGGKKNNSVPVIGTATGSLPTRVQSLYSMFEIVLYLYARHVESNSFAKKR